MGVWRWSRFGLCEGLQIKCLLELNCVCPVPFNSARAFVALGSRVVEGTKIRMPSRAATMDLMLTVVGVEPKEGESPVELLFIMDATWPQGAAAVRFMKQDHQFLTKISTYFYLVDCLWSYILLYLICKILYIKSYKYILLTVLDW